MGSGEFEMKRRRDEKIFSPLGSFGMERRRECMSDERNSSDVYFDKKELERASNLKRAYY